MKTPNSEPFEVTEYEYNQLKAKGMVALVEGAVEEEPEPQAEQVPSDPVPEKPQAEPEVKPKTTRSKTSK